MKPTDELSSALFGAARSLPTELSLEEVETLFLNPAPVVLPKVKRWPHLKFWFMFALLVSLLLAYFSLPFSGIPPQLSAGFPVGLTGQPVEDAPFPPQPQPSKKRTTAVNTKAVAPLPVIPTRLAPAFAPKKMSAPATTPKPGSSTSASNSRHNVKADFQMPAALFAGGYTKLKSGLVLTYTEVENGPTHLGFLELTADEQQLIDRRTSDQVTIERAAGSLLLYGDRKEGDFEFLPNTTYRDRLNKRAWGDAAAPLGSVVVVTTNNTKNVAIPAGPRVSVRPQDQIWFRYFTKDIDDNYLALLRRAGYTDQDLMSLWKLANAMIGYDRLDELLKLLRAVLTDKPSLESIASLKYEEDALRKLKARGERMTFEEFQRTNYRPTIIQALTGVIADSTQSAAWRETHDQKWSTDLPGTVTKTINGPSRKGKVHLKGNFKVRISKDPDLKEVVVYGPDKVVEAMKQKSRLNTIKLINKRKQETIYVDMPVGIHWTWKPGRKINISAKPGLR